MENSAIIVFKIKKRNFETDLEVPLDISANELVNALNDDKILRKIKKIQLLCLKATNYCQISV